MKTPETVLVALQLADGTVGVMQFVTCEYGPTDVPRWLREPSQVNIQEEINRAAAGMDPAKLPILSWRVVTKDEIPTDRTYRDAWVDAGPGSGIVHDMPRAREIHRNRLRAERTPLLAELDIAYTRADEKTGTIAVREKNDIAARKQVLRNVPEDPRIDVAQTIEELKALTLDSLKL